MGRSPALAGLYEIGGPPFYTIVSSSASAPRPDVISLQRVRPITSVTPTTASITRNPDSPIQNVASSPWVARLNAPLMIAFQAACATTQGQMLPVPSRIQARIEPNAAAATIRLVAENSGDGRAAYPLPSNGTTCHAPQIRALRSTGRGAPTSIRRGSTYPRQPISSPAASGSITRVPSVAARARVIAKLVTGPAAGARSGRAGGANWARPVR